MSALSDLEFRVYMHYIVAANDLGVMPATAAKFQGDNSALSTRPARKVQAAIDQIVELGLLQVFTAEGQRYLWCLKWQDWQGLKWPRRSHYPVPPDRGEASPATARLFRDYGERLRNTSEDSEEIGSPSRARNPNPKTNPKTNPHPDAREDDEPRWVAPEKQAAPLIDGRLQRIHGGHVFCPPGRANLCVTTHIHEQTRDALGSDEAAMALYVAAIQALGDQPCTDDALPFWRNARQRAIAPLSTAPPAAVAGKGEQSRQAMQRVASRIASRP